MSKGDNLFDWGAWHHSDPDTSETAAKSIKASKIEQLVYDTLIERGPLTAEEIGNVLQIRIQTVTPRTAPLERKGMVIQTEERRKGASGRPRIVYQAIPMENVVPCPETASEKKARLIREKLIALQKELKRIKELTSSIAADAQNGINTEKLSGNVVKQEFWAGYLACAQHIKFELNQPDNQQ